MRFVFALILAGAVAGAAFAQQATPPQLAEEGRYALEPSNDGGFLRVDKRTGAVSHCREANGRWSCRSVLEERDALEDEIGRLSAENERLKQRLAAVEKGRSDAPEQPSLQLPSKEDMDKVMDFFEEMVDRVYTLVERLQRKFDSRDG